MTIALLVIAIALSVFSFILRYREVSFWKTRKREVEAQINKRGG